MHEVAHQRLADRVLAAAGADDRDAARVEEALRSRPTRRGARGPASRRSRCRWSRSGTPAASRRPRSRRPRGSRPPGRSGSSGGCSGSTSATNRSMPRSRPAWARCSSSSWAIPRPWWRVLRPGTPPRPRPRSPRILGGIRSKRPTAIISSATVSTNATRSTWSTWVNRCTSRSDSVRHRREEPEVLRLGARPARRSRRAASASSGRIGRMCAVRPSRSRTSASQCRGYGAGRDPSLRPSVGGAHSAKSTVAAGPARRAPAMTVAVLPGPEWRHGTLDQATSPARRLRGAHPRHRRRRRDARLASSSTPTPSSTPGPCPTPATASSRCSAGSSTRWTTWACAPTAATSRAPASSARSWAGCTRTATARSTTPWSAWRSRGRCGCRSSTGTATSARPTTPPRRCATPSAGWRRPRWR